MSQNDYDNLDFLLDILNDAIYKKTPERNYVFKSIQKKGIKLHDLKKDKSFDGNFILNGDFEYLGSNNGRMEFLRTVRPGYSCSVYFGFYNDDNKEDLHKDVIYNMGIMYILSELVVNEKFPHSILPVMLFDIDYNKVVKKIPKVSELKSTAQSENMFCMVTENYYNHIPLDIFIKKNGESLTEHDWKVLLFQIYCALYKFSERVSNFRHNKLSLNSIRIHTMKEKNMKYKIGDMAFMLNDVRFVIKITDYDMTTTSDYLTNNRMKNIKNNDYYDVHYFTNSLRVFLDQNKIKIPQTIDNFIHEIVPDNLVVKTKSIKFDGLDGLDDNTDISQLQSHKSIPTMILKKNNFFKEFIIVDKQTMDMSASPMDKESSIKLKKYIDSEFDMSDYERSITESEEGPRLIGKRIDFPNKKSDRNINTTNTMNRSKKNQNNIVGYPEEGSILAMADKKLNKKLKGKSKSKSKKTKTRHYNADLDTDFEGSVSKIVNKKSVKKDAVMSTFTSVDDSDKDGGINSTFFRELRRVGRNDSPSETKTETKSLESDTKKYNTKNIFKSQEKSYLDDLDEDDDSSSSSSSDNNNDDSSSSSSDDDELGSKFTTKSEDDEESGNSDAYRKIMEAIGGFTKKIGDMDSKLESGILEEGMSRPKKKSKKSKKSKNRQNVGEMGYESYLDPKIQQRLKALPENYIGELPDHFASMMPDENGNVMNPRNIEDRTQTQMNNPMANILGFGGQSSMGPSMGSSFGNQYGSEVPEGLHGMSGMGNMNGMGMSQLMPQPMAQPMVQPMAQSMTQPMAQPMAQSMTQPMAQPMAQSMAQPMMQSMTQPMMQPMGQMNMMGGADKSWGKKYKLVAKDGEKDYTGKKDFFF